MSRSPENNPEIKQIPRIQKSLREYFQKYRYTPPVRYTLREDLTIEALKQDWIRKDPSPESGTNTTDFTFNPERN